MKKTLVSCIIPVYNAAPYIKQGVESLLSQTHKNLEIILVDDHSTDKSWEMCQKFASTYDNVLAFQTKKNSGGPLRGRELGIEKSTGDWIVFMDCDDYVEPQYIEHLLEATENGKYDIAVTGHALLHADGRKEYFPWDDYSQTTIERLTTFYQHFLTHNFWTDPADTAGQNLVRAEVAKKTDLSKYSNTVWAEDTLMALAFLANSKNGVNFVNHHDFMWRQRKGSGSHGGFSNRANKSEFYKSCREIFHRANIYKEISQNLPLISVVIPIYNVEKYLADCLNSVTGQSYQNLEIICVNDGTPDGSEAIIDACKQNDARIVKISQKNMGLNIARASGAKAARGQYLSFVDADDMVHVDYISELYEKIIENDVDIAVCGFKAFAKKSELKNFDFEEIEEKIIKDHDDLLAYYLRKPQKIPNVYQMTAWGKLYKKEVIEKTDWQFSNYRANEDDFETVQWYKNAKNGAAIYSSQRYFYRNNPKSITLSPYSNIDPEGKKISHFQLLDELYEKTKHIIGDPAFDVHLVDRFARQNSWRLHDYYLDGRLTKQDVVQFAENSGKISHLYSQMVQERDKQIRELNEQVHLGNQQMFERDQHILSIVNSRSWKAVTRVQPVLSAPLRLKRKLRVRTRIRDTVDAKKYRGAWVISDRIDEANDNGVLFYDYLAKQHPEINAFYVISKASPDFQKLRNRGVKVIDYNSEEHRRVMKYADAEISAFFNFAPFDINTIGRTKPVKRAFIRHGMEQSDLSPHYANLPMDLFAITDTFSQDFYKKGKGIVDVRELNLRVVGMPRFDLANQMMRNSGSYRRDKIVIAPTWRRFLKTDDSVPISTLKNSEYYKNWQRLLGSDELKSLSKKYKIIFIPHPEIANSNLLTVPKYIKVQSYGDIGGTKNLYQLALQTELYISDYTSTAFDFAFLGAKVAHFNFDDDNYYSDKHRIYKSWFDMNKDGLGPSFQKVNDLLKYLHEGKFVANQKNIDKIWKSIPKNSNELIYCEMKSLIEGRNESK